jgi:hypothetical protein
MKYTKLFLLVFPVLASCAAPATPAPTRAFTQEPTAPIIIADVSSTAPISVTIDPAMGSIEGTISWADSLKSTGEPVSNVNIELNGHSSSTPRYKIKNDLNGHYKFVNIEPVNYGVGVYFNLPISERRCENPEFLYGQELGWLHYATALRRDIWYDVIFSSKDLMVNPGETVVMDFVLKCP